MLQTPFKASRILWKWQIVQKVSMVYCDTSTYTNKKNGWVFVFKGQNYQKKKRKKEKGEQIKS